MDLAHQAYHHLATRRQGLGTEGEVETALDVLARLSEQSTDGRLRDNIAHVRTELWDALGEVPK